MRLVQAHLRGAAVRELAKRFPAGKSAIHDHLTKCEASNIARQQLHRHRAIDWQPILDLLSNVGDEVASSVRDASNSRDIKRVIAAVTVITENVAQRIEIADRMRNHEQREIAEAFVELAGWVTMQLPTAAPGVIARITEDRWHAKNVLEEDRVDE